MKSKKWLRSTLARLKGVSARKQKYACYFEIDSRAAKHKIKITAVENQYTRVKIMKIFFYF